MSIQYSAISKRNDAVARVRVDGIELIESTLTKKQHIIKRALDLESQLRRVLPKWIFSKKGFLVAYRDKGVEKILSMDLPVSKAKCYLIPDLEALKLLAEKPVVRPPSFNRHHEEYSARRKVIFWRGSTTGGGRIDSIDHLISTSRVKACMAAKSIDGYDIKIAAVVQADEAVKKYLEKYLVDQGLFSEWVRPETFNGFFATLTLQGNASPWGILEKMSHGILMISPPHFSQTLFSSLLIPGKHFLPLSDVTTSSLEEVSQWLAENELCASRIAWKGRILAFVYLKSIRHILMAKITIEN